MSGLPKASKNAGISVPGLFFALTGFLLGLVSGLRAKTIIFETGRQNLKFLSRFTSGLPA
jgi:hypothetical protein